MGEGPWARPVPEPDPVRVGVLLAWSPLRVDVDPLTGEAFADPRLHGLSAADEAALEWALRLGDAWGASVRAVCLGPSGAEDVLRRALETGVREVVRIDGPVDAEPWQRAAALAAAVRDCGAVLAGSWSPRFGSGSVPAFVAHELAAAAALGVVELVPGSPGAVVADRKLDGGRRERLGLSAPCVLSVEPEAGRLRRAPLDAVLAARDVTIPVVTASALGVTVEPRPFRRTHPFRPPARPVPAPAGATPLARIGDLVGLRTAGPAETRVIRADPRSAAKAVVDALRAWGYLP